MICPVCSSKNTVDYKVVRLCTSCSHVYEYPPQVTMKYNSEYIKTRYDVYPTTDAMSHLRTGFVSAHALGPKLLDVGYGNGAFLKVAAKAGFDVYGSDLHGADYGIRDVPLVSDEKWGVITFFDSIEHFPDFAPALHALKRSRSAVISVPWRPHWFPENLNWKHHKPGEHLHYFNAESLEALMKRAGFRIIKISVVEDAVRGKLSDGSGNILTAAFVNLSVEP